ncbi:MAG: hypothetical protein EBR82_83865, partial [Caulobacteraceae bacterium]|nr:hypothetical protein [Caulobacteraceae bacterium]
DNLKKSVEHAKARPGWRLEHLSDSGSAYLVHEASGKMVRVSDHAVPQTREREMFGGTPPWAGNEAINHRTGDARREFDRIAKEIEDNHAESMAEANPPAKPDSSSEQKGTVTVKDGTAKDVGARRIEEARTLYGGMRRIAGWIFADDPATPALIHPTEDRVVLFSPKAGSGSSLLEARTRAQAFAQENPVASKPSTSPPGEMVVKDLRVQPQPGGSVPAATNQERANGEEAPQAERLLNAGTASRSGRRRSTRAWARARAGSSTWVPDLPSTWLSTSRPLLRRGWSKQV